MKSETFFSQRIFPLIFMGAVTVVAITLVTGIYLLTEDQVLRNELLFERQAILDAAGIEFDPDDIERVYEQRVTKENGWYSVQLPDDERGYVISIIGAGLWGPIEMMLGFYEDLERMTGIAILSHNETPGLGARIEQREFTEQFRGRSGPFEMVDEGTAEEDHEIDGLTGATRTTVAVGEIINRGVRNAPDTVRGE